ncbi:hypothetical protein OsI_36080 [Oryza sativa Indica Group]|uniref:Major facilitator superfamily (MFS) profile domain-containing protein n=2 Tax=Oryza TaxID=4527 RepID=A2ZE68_ORYSI|nr:hypothetical protein OsI_36080 [Oryza sativa Indica Group]
MRGAVLVAVAAAIGNYLQGWDNATIAGAVLYIKREFALETQPAVEGLVVAMSLIGATIITTFSGPVSDLVGRRPMLIASSLLYFAGGLIMLWSPNVYVLLLARLVDGFGVGLAVTLVPVYISETSPPEIRGRLNTLPQFTGSGGMFMSYCMIFAMTLSPSPNWRIMLGVLFVPSLLYLFVTVFYLPESPRWLVSKGRMKEARVVLEMLRGREDVSGEMALLVEGLGTGGDTEIEDYVVGPSEGDAGENEQARDTVTLYGPEQGLSWVAQPVAGGRGSMLGSSLGLQASRHGSMYEQMKDPVVALLGSVHERLPESGGGATGSMRGSTLFPNLGSMLSVNDRPGGSSWDEENVQPGDDDLDEEEEEYLSDDGKDDDDGGGLQAPLLSRQSTDVETKNEPASGQVAMQRHSSIGGGGGVETASTMGIGGGWQLAWKWTENVGPDGVKRGAVKRMYLHEESEAAPGGDAGGGGAAGAAGDAQSTAYVHAAALVSRSMLYTKDVLIGQSPTEPAFANPPEAVAAAASTGPAWRELLEPGVRHALFCGVTIQILQQFSGINGVLYYTPQILDQAGVSVLLASLGLSGDSTSILISGLTTLLMLPSIGVAMRLMDASGRRALLLWTLPVLVASLAVLVVANVVPMAATAHAALSTGSVIVYFCCFVMGFGPIPNILCAEIFPTRVRGLCIAICSLTFWLGDIAVTYSLPVMLSSVGLAGVFSFYAAVCCVALVFVALKVPETKGLPLEVIIEFFNVGAKAGTLPDEEFH